MNPVAVLRHCHGGQDCPHSLPLSFHLIKCTRTFVPKNRSGERSPARTKAIYSMVSYCPYLSNVAIELLI